MKVLKKIVSDSKWSGASGGRCISDFTRTIQFKKELTEKELSQIKTYLNDNDCPGWTGIKVNNQGNGLYNFYTTWDSSD